MTEQCSIIPAPQLLREGLELTLVTSRWWPVKRRRAAPDLQLDTATLCRDRDRDRGQHQSRAGGVLTSLVTSYQDLCTVHRTGNRLLWFSAPRACTAVLTDR